MVHKALIPTPKLPFITLRYVNTDSSSIQCFQFKATVLLILKLSMGDC